MTKPEQISAIKQSCSAHWGEDETEVFTYNMGRKRPERLALPRWCAMLAMRNLLFMRMENIGTATNSDYTTVSYALKELAGFAQSKDSRSRFITRRVNECLEKCMEAIK